MLTDILKQSHAQNDREIFKESLRKEAISSIGELTNALLDSLNSGVAEVYEKQRAVDTQFRKMQSNLLKLQEQTAQWFKLLNDFNGVLKEAGDLENYLMEVESQSQELIQLIEVPTQGG
mmetsp:Transcript_24558/g.40415  ORF Transcript_24558/g.40415 Transcript_24558/m.40415 type:complete len:119 (+) Transcript_24558:101-457(+)